MGSSFNPQILVDKLSKLNSSQGSIETLSQWCMFHMNKAKQVVETWDRQFHCSARDQRLAFLYLANDILQNSRRKGGEFVGEFWKVLPNALRDVIDKGDEFGRNAALRLIGIWEERKVFGSRGQVLKEELMARHLENNSRNGKPLGTKLKQPVGNVVDKIVSGYHAVYGRQLDEEIIISKCRNAISCIEKVEREIGGGISSGQQNGSAYAEEVQCQNTTLKDCIEQLTAIESSRASLVSHLREALQEQELKLDQVRNQLQVAHSQSEQARKIHGQFVNCDNVQLQEQTSNEFHTPIAPCSFIPRKEQSAPVLYTRQVPFAGKAGHVEEDPRKSAAAAVAAKLTSSTSSAEMLSFVLSSLASEGVIGNPMNETSGDYPPEKKPKLEGDQSPYIPVQTSQLPVLPFPPPLPLQHNATTTAQQPAPSEPPPPRSSSPPPLPPPPPMAAYSLPQFMQTAGSINGLPYSYSTPQQLPPLKGVSPFTASPNSYQSFQPSEGSFYTHSSSVPVSRQ